VCDVTARLVFQVDRVNDAAHVTGPGARELLVDAGARRPYWSHLSGCWFTSAKVAINALALAQRRRIEYDVRDCDLT
jgi:hypothetical protein